jgi:hypothetical protein
MQGRRFSCLWTKAVPKSQRTFFELLRHTKETELMNHKSTLRQRTRQARDSRHDQMRKLAAMDTRSLLDDTLQVAQHADSFTPDDYIEYLFAVRILRCRIEKAETGALLVCLRHGA